MTEPEVRQIIPASLRPKISPSPPSMYVQRGVKPYGENSPFEKGGQKGDLSVTSAAVIVWSS